MATQTIKLNILSEQSINNAKSEILAYQETLVKKCEQLVSELADVGISTAKQNVGGFGRYIIFTKQTNIITDGCTAIMYATNSGTIISQWKTKDGVKSADVSPLLMVEFGSGLKAEKVKKKLDVAGVGRGTFPEQTHADDDNGWYYMDLAGVWHHSYGITPKQPVYKAFEQMQKELSSRAEKVFKRW